MEVDQIPCKFPRLSNGNGSLSSLKISQKMDDQYPDDEDGEREQISTKDGERGGGVDLGVGVGRFYGWPSSRIVRVTRASGGKDRHSKVLTSKGLRDRRVRLSVNTAIQFYDLQDRLGYDQPSKAVEWLINAAASSIAELPPMSTPFPDTPKQLSDEKRSSTAGSDQVSLDMDGCGGEPSYFQQQQVTKSSACSSNSENSKGSGLSLSRSANGIEAWERAKESVAEKEKEKDDQPESCQVSSLNPNSQITSFTELLRGGFSNDVHTNNSSVHERVDGGGNMNEPTFFQKSPCRQWSSTSMDYLTNGLLGPPGQIQFVNSVKRNPSSQFTVAGYYHSELQNLDFGPDQLVSVGGNSNNGNNQHNGGSSGCNLNFAISNSASSAGLAGFNRGTLQSNSSSPSLLPSVHRFPPADSSPTSFLIGASMAPVDNHHHDQFPSGFDAPLQLFYGADAHADSGRNAGQKGKGKS